jgi:nucleotide-binding universal stress UspA family protein
MRSILIFADRGPAMQARLETALAIARLGKGHVSVLVDTPIARYTVMDSMGGSYLVADALKEALADDDAYAALLTAQLANEDVAFDVLRSEREPVEALIIAARLADVVVVSRSCLFAGELALTAHCPVLVVPDGAMLPVPVGRACIAWDGGDEAAMALRAGAPLLKGCDQVDVLCVAEKSGGFPATDALRYLSRHGVKAELREVPKAGSTEETLAVEVARLGADLLVMGAYGHSRMREYMFGGVTRYFLEESATPALLLAH